MINNLNTNFKFTTRKKQICSLLSSIDQSVFFTSLFHDTDQFAPGLLAGLFSDGSTDRRMRLSHTLGSLPRTNHERANPRCKSNRTNPDRSVSRRVESRRILDTANAKKLNNLFCCSWTRERNNIPPIDMVNLTVCYVNI